MLTSFSFFLLNGLHEETLKISKVLTPNEESSKIIEEWTEVGKGKAVANVLVTELEESPISSIFCSKVRSVLRKQGSKSSSVTYQLFNCLPLDIIWSDVHYLEYAFEIFMSREPIDGFTDQKTSLEVRASKQATFDRLPKIMILQLKRFGYDWKGPYKSQKYIVYPKEFTVKVEFLANVNIAPTNADRTYKLFAIISHHGIELEGGHYTCDILQSDGTWVIFDDNKLRKGTEKEVFDRKAYVLFYMLTSFK